MSNSSSIEWTNSTWNPTNDSPGCKNCYAETLAHRLQAMGNHRYTNGFELTLHPDALLAPLSWEKPRLIFVNSMSDLFHERVPDYFIADVYDVMCRADWHTYQVLTKRSDRMRDLMNGPLRETAKYRHIWLGASVENRRHGLPRIDDLRATPAGLRFLSIEPLLLDVGKLNLKKIDWVIVGGESGHHSRPIEQAWVESILRQCRAAKVPFFFKQ